MDIAERLKYYIDYLNIPSSQFADAASIPRPTLSQLLNGRNKKVSNEFITKIHDAFPNLSVMWLLFGDGDMELTPNIQMSEAQNAGFSDELGSLFTDEELFSRNLQPNFGQLPNESKKVQQGYTLSNTGAKVKNDDTAAAVVSDSGNAQVQSSSQNTRTVQSIMIFYSDNSFETFVPSSK